MHTASVRCLVSLPFASDLGSVWERHRKKEPVPGPDKWEGLQQEGRPAWKRCSNPYGYGIDASTTRLS